MKSRGYITLLSVLILGAIGVAVATTLLVLGIGASRTSFASEQSLQARALAHACAEEALQQIDDSTSFSGSSGLSLGQGSCTYTVTNLGGSNRNIEASGTVGQVVRKSKVIIDAINPQINVTSWQEVADF